MLRLIRRYATARYSTTAPPRYGGVLRKGPAFEAALKAKELETPKPEPPEPAPRIPRRSLLGLMWLWVKVGLFLHIFCSYGYSLVSPWGASMLPTLYLSGDWVVVSHLHRRGKNVEVGDIVSVKHPLFPQEGGIMKRIVGMPGDLVLAATPGQSDVMVRVPVGHCWLAGDNLLHSRDSRIFGAVPLALIRGKVIARILPWTERRWLNNPLEPLSERDMHVAFNE